MAPEAQATIDAMRPDLRADFLRRVERIDGLAQLYCIAHHLMAGDAYAARLVAMMPPQAYAPHDDAIRLGWALGMLNRG